MTTSQIRCLSEYESKSVLRKYNIPLAAEALVKSADDALAFADKTGYPLVMKVDSPDIPHKTEAGVVKLNICDPDSLRVAYTEILQKAKDYNPEAKINGVLVQEMVTDGTEVIIGMKNDAQFGPTLLFGLGGIFVEVMKDVSLRIAPVTKREAMEMLEDTKGFRILQGARGKKPADINALCDLLVRIGLMVVEQKARIVELDLNPVIVLPEGQGVKVVDALILEKE
ncbi:MAG: acetate--CoA ligase family protein [Desulfitobacteriaceae bacterium]|nr:acetate--CoA ligase family protein [Desulfitobacteriaceae bacterium]